MRHPRPLPRNASTSPDQNEDRSWSKGGRRPCRSSSSPQTEIPRIAICGISRRVARKAHATANPPENTTHKTLTIAPRRSYWTMLWITPKQPNRQKTAPRKIAVDNGGMLFQYSAVRARGNVLSRGMLSLPSWRKGPQEPSMLLKFRCRLPAHISTTKRRKAEHFCFGCPAKPLKVDGEKQVLGEWSAIRSLSGTVGTRLMGASRVGVKVGECLIRPALGND